MARQRPDCERFRDDAALGGDVVRDRATVQVSRYARCGALIALSHGNRVSLPPLAIHWPERDSPVSVLPVCFPWHGRIAVLRHGQLESGRVELPYREASPPFLPIVSSTKAIARSISTIHRKPRRGQR